MGYHSLMKPLLAVAIAASLSACVAKPVLYPNPHYNEVGKEQSKTDIKDCGTKADEFVKNDRATRTAASMGQGAAIGAAAGAATGAVFGSIGRGALGGGIGGAAAGLVGGLFHTRQPAVPYKNFVDRCLHDRGYDVIGWQ